jgi:hypothetical protein
MNLCKRILSLFAILLGLIGFVGCIAAVVGVWSARARLSQSTEYVFERLDESLNIVRERVLQTQDYIDASKVTTSGIEKTLKDWTKKEASDRIALRLDVVDKTEQLASTLQQAGHWLEVSESSVELVKQALSLGKSTGAPMDTTSVDGLIDEIASLRVQLSEATEFVARIHERTAKASEEPSSKERIEQTVQLVLRIVTTLGTIDSRLEKFENGLSDTQLDLHELQTKTLRWILVVTIGITLLIVWMATGQGAL